MITELFNSLSDEVVVGLLTAIAAVIAAQWQSFRQSARYQQMSWKQQLIARIVSAAVQHTYREYVRDRKNEKGGRKLVGVERQIAMDKAQSHVKELAHKHGVLSEVPARDELRDIIEREIAMVKRAYVKPLIEVHNLPDPKLGRK